MNVRYTDGPSQNWRPPQDLSQYGHNPDNNWVDPSAAHNTPRRYYDDSRYSPPPSAPRADPRRLEQYAVRFLEGLLGGLSQTRARDLCPTLDEMVRRAIISSTDELAGMMGSVFPKFRSDEDAYVEAGETLCGLLIHAAIRNMGGNLEYDLERDAPRFISDVRNASRAHQSLMGDAVDDRHSRHQQPARDNRVVYMDEVNSVRSDTRSSYTQDRNRYTDNSRRTSGPQTSRILQPQAQSTGPGQSDIVVNAGGGLLGAIAEAERREYMDEQPVEYMDYADQVPSEPRRSNNEEPYRDPVSSNRYVSGQHIPIDATPPLHRDPIPHKTSSDPVYDKMVNHAAHHAGEQEIRHWDQMMEAQRAMGRREDGTEPDRFDHSDLSDLQAEFPDVEFVSVGDVDGIMEDLDDADFDPTDESVDTLALMMFAVRSLVDSTMTGGWKFYEPSDGNIPFDREVFSWPKAYNAATQVKFRFISPKRKLIEIIKPKYKEGTKLDIADHIADDLTVRSKGSFVDVLDILSGTQRRLNAAENRKEKPADPKNKIDAIVATADQKAFDNKIHHTLTDGIADALKSKLEAERKTAIEGFNECRLEPIYFGDNAPELMLKLGHKLSAVATFSAFAESIPAALSGLPDAFVDRYKERLTAHFNDWLRNAMGANFDVDDFLADYSVAEDELIKQLGEATARAKLNEEYRNFARFARRLPSPGSVYKDALPKEMGCDDYLVFATNISTIALPIDSTTAEGLVPMDGDAYIGVPESECPVVYGLLTTMLKSGKEVFKGQSDVLRIVTQDNMEYYVGRGAFSVEGDSYIVARRNRVAELLD